MDFTADLEELMSHAPKDRFILRVLFLIMPGVRGLAINTSSCV
jgi:hypothetical protein